MNPVPFALKILGGGQRIVDKIDAKAVSMGLPRYSERPHLYRFPANEFGTVGFPPRLACNVYYVGGEGDAVSLGRVDAR